CADLHRGGFRTGSPRRCVRHHRALWCGWQGGGHAGRDRAFPDGLRARHPHCRHHGPPALQRAESQQTRTMNLFPSPYLPEPSDPYALETDPPPRQDSGTGVLFINLGTPDEPTPQAIRRYLKEFLSDPRVIEIPQWLWQPILRLFVLSRRPKALQPRYQDIWWKDGAPLLVASRQQAQGVEQVLAQRGIRVKTALGMRYGNPSIASAMESLRDQGCERILVVPLYPQYAASTTATAVDKVNEYVRQRRNQPELRFVKRYADDSGYIAALVETIRAHWDAHGKPEDRKSGV